MTRLLATALLLAAAYSVSAQGAPRPSVTTLRANASKAVEVSRAKAKQPPCEDTSNGQTGINFCFGQEVRSAEENYLQLVRALGAILRSGKDSQPSAKPVPIPFDAAEASWQRYRQQACDAATKDEEGGSIHSALYGSCFLTITQHHVEELWALYSDAGTY